MRCGAGARGAPAARICRLEARHGVDALRVAERHADEIHLLIADVVMPHMSGRELAERLATVRPQ
jgi:YesN/AraC family two-component response regulator